jgi:tRNA dimethylallyltransferase
MKKVIIIAGATASGKTKFAIDLALSIAGEIINCDSLQIYDSLKILTAYPAPSELSIVNHKLFGYMHYDQRSTAVDWAKRAARAVEDTFWEGKVPLIVGGTGLYIDTLVNGISRMPVVNSETRKAVDKLAKENFSELCARLYATDKRLEHVIPPQNHRQIVRAYEVFVETGESILSFMASPPLQFLKDIQYECHIVECERRALYERISRRFEKMLQSGAIEEVEQLLKQIGPYKNEIVDDFPVFKAIGAREIAAYLRGDISFENMKTTAITNIRHYAKRQITWFKNRKIFRVRSTNMSKLNVIKFGGSAWHDGHPE